MRGVLNRPICYLAATLLDRQTYCFRAVFDGSRCLGFASEISSLCCMWKASNILNKRQRILAAVWWCSLQIGNACCSAGGLQVPAVGLIHLLARLCFSRCVTQLCSSKIHLHQGWSPNTSVVTGTLTSLWWRGINWAPLVQVLLDPCYFWILYFSLLPEAGMFPSLKEKTLQEVAAGWLAPSDIFLQLCNT